MNRIPFVSETSATVYKFIVKDSKTWPVIETWTDKTVKRQYYQNITEIDTGYGVRYNWDKLNAFQPNKTVEVTHNLDKARVYACRWN